MMPKPKSEMNKGEQMFVVFTAGYIAGVLCGAVSHPADTMVSKINKVKMDGGLMTKAKSIYYGTPTIKVIHIYIYIYILIYITNKRNCTNISQPMISCCLIDLFVDVDVDVDVDLV